MTASEQMQMIEGMSPYRIMLYDQEQVREERRKLQRREQYRRWCARNPDYQRNYQKQYRKKKDKSISSGVFTNPFLPYKERLSRMTPEQQVVWKASRAEASRRYRAKHRDKMRQYQARYMIGYYCDEEKKEKRNAIKRAAYERLKSDPEKYEQAMQIARKKNKEYKARQKNDNQKSIQLPS